MQAIDYTDLLTAARSVPLFEVIDGPAPDNCRLFAGPYMPDDGELLASTMRGMPKRLAYVVARDANGLFNIYRRQA